MKAIVIDSYEVSKMKRNLRAGINLNGGLSLNVLTDDEVNEIHRGSLEILDQTGVFVEDEKALDCFAAGGATEYGDVYFMTQPRFETGDPRYAWLNSVVAVGEGRVRPSAVEYRVYEVVNG